LQYGRGTWAVLSLRRLVHFLNPKIARIGRPQFATDTSGAVVWDMGAGVTPFGDSVNLAGAFAQRLMFPGQYADVETGDSDNGDTVTLSHNWHRTYDPTLGRYLQSDPIGLAGGLNRYAYVGGNPAGYVDPMGLDFVQGEQNGYVPAGIGLRFNRNRLSAEKVARESSGLEGQCVKYLLFYKLVKYGGPWDFKTIDQSNRRYDYRFGYSPDFENFGNWHYGVVGAAMGFSESTLLNAAGAAQIKKGNAKREYMNEALGCPSDSNICAIVSSPRHWDDPNDQYWIKKGIDDYKNGNLSIRIGSDYRINSR